MKTQNIKHIIFTIAFVLITSNIFAGYKKNINKTWDIDQVKAIKVDNSFGNINITNTQSNEVSIDIHIEFFNLPQNRAQYLANQIKFRFWINDDTLNAKTSFSDEFKTNQEFKIEYNINIPNNISQHITNKYGNITLVDLFAKGFFHVEYGDLNAQNLSAPSNKLIEIYVQYGKATVNKVNNLKANILYSKFDANTIEEANIESQYSVFHIQNIENLTSKSEHDYYNVQSINQIAASSGFSVWSLNSIGKKVTINNRYGEIHIQNVQPNFERVEIENQYGNIMIHTAPKANYTLKSQTYYSNVQYPKGTIHTHTIENDKSTFEAAIGKTENNSLVKITSRYGSIQIK